MYVVLLVVWRDCVCSVVGVSVCVFVVMGPGFDVGSTGVCVLVVIDDVCARVCVVMCKYSSSNIIL